MRKDLYVLRRKRCGWDEGEEREEGGGCLIILHSIHYEKSTLILLFAMVE